MTAAVLPHESTRAYLSRTWSAYAALGAGLVLLALSSEHLGDHLLLGIGLAVLGGAEVLWAVAGLRGPAPWPRVALGVLLVGGAGWLVVAAGGTLSGADAAAGGLQLGAAILLAVGISRVPADPPPPDPEPANAVGRLLVLAVGSLVVAAITVPGLAATDAGDQAHMPGMSSMHGMHG